jgi:hypothetical protein
MHRVLWEAAWLHLHWIARWRNGLGRFVPYIQLEEVGLVSGQSSAVVSVVWGVTWLDCSGFPGLRVCFCL